MPKYVLHYFDGRGRAELLRLLFAYGGIPFTDNRLSFPDWPATKPNASCCKLRTTRKLGLINYWPIDGNTNDTIGTAHMYDLVNAELTADRFGKKNSAISFKNGYARVPEGVYFSGVFSVVAWIKVKSTGNTPRIFDFGNGPNADNVFYTYSRYFNLTIGSGIFFGSLKDYVDFKVSIKLNSWTHIVVIKTPTEYRAYLNGKFINSKASSFLPKNIIRQYNYIGKSNWIANSLANADMDDIKMFNVALSDHDVEFHYKSNVAFIV